jgi:hypothetical protein
MTYLSEDPTFLAGGFLLLAGAFSVALRVTQQGKYLIRAGVALGLALLVVVIEWLWVTDTERIEQVVYALRRAVLNSDVGGVLTQMTPDVQFSYSRGDTALHGEETRALIRTNLNNTSFDFIRIGNLQVNAGRQSRRGTAEFRVLAKGSRHLSLATVTIGTADSVWSLGFQETEPGVWKVNRITPVQIPREALAMPGGPPPERSRLGFNDRKGGPWPTGRPGPGRLRGIMRPRERAAPPSPAETN